MRGLWLAGAAALAIGLGGGAQAATVLDAGGDYLASYGGPKTADLDILSFTVDYDSGAGAFTIGATMAGAIAPLPALGVYVIGVSTGPGGNAPFTVDAPNVRFNQAFQVRRDATSTLAGVTPTISGSSFSLVVPEALFASTGFAPNGYTFNLWSRDTTQPGASANADFAPNNSMLATPEPAAWAMTLLGLGLAGGAARVRSRRRRALAA